MRRLCRSGWLLFALLLASSANGQPPLVRLGDLRGGVVEGSSNPAPFCSLGAQALFGPTTLEGVTLDYDRLWVTDGTPTSTHRVSDLVPSYAGDDPLPVPLGGTESCAVSGGVGYFTALGPAGGRQIWRSDGTSDGTRSVADVQESGCAGHGQQIAATHRYVVYSSELGCDLNQNLWTSDGTPAGTARLLPTRFTQDVVHFSASGENAAYFVATPVGGAPTLFRTDGDPSGAGTVAVAPATGYADWSDASAFVVVGERLYFVMGSALWTTDGTSGGTRQLSSGFIYAPAALSRLPVLGAELGYLAEGPTGKLQFYLYDTATGTHQLVFERADSYGAAVDPVRVAGGHWLIEGERFGTGLPVHFSSDGTADGTIELPAFVRLDGTPAADRPGTPFLFEHSDGLLWRSDGTKAGTKPIPGTEGQGLAIPGADAGQYVLASERLLLARDDGIHGVEPWVVDPVDGTFSLLANLASRPRGSLDFTFEGVTLGDGAFFGIGPSSQFELWRSDGTRTGTQPALVPPPDPAPRNFQSPSPRADGVALFADSGGTPALTRLWRTDGAASGTQVIWSRPGASGLIAGIFQVADGWLVRAGFSSSTLWRSDGTSSGTVEATDLGIQPVFSGSLTDSAGSHVLLFGGQAVSDGSGVELWRTDLTSAGTFRIADLVPGTASSSPHAFVPDTGRFHALFAASDPSGGEALWGTDGSAVGTVRLAVFPDGRLISFARLGSAPSAPVLALVYSRGIRLEQLWRVDPAGTRPLGSWEYVGDSRIVAAGARAYFGASDGVRGEELWVTDGNSVSLLLDAAPGEASGFSTYPRDPLLESAGDRIVFAPCDSKGCEPWVSDGSPAGTRRLMDVNPGPGSSTPRLLARLSDHWLLAADDGATGAEPWSLRLSALTEAPPRLGDLDGDGDVDAADAQRFAAAFGTRVGDADFLLSADLDGDGAITLVDYQHWLAEFGSSPPPPSLPPPVPTGVPTPIPLLPSAAIVLLAAGCLATALSKASR